MQEEGRCVCSCKDGIKDGRMREGPLNCRCSVSISSGPDALSRASDPMALATSPADTIMSGSL